MEEEKSFVVEDIKALCYLLSLLFLCVLCALCGSEKSY
jgi:hypothetical protein